MNAATYNFPQLIGDNIFAYVRFLMEWTDAAPQSAVGQVHRGLVMLGDSDEEDCLSAQTFSMKRLGALVESLSGGIARGEAPPACPNVVRDAMVHVTTNGRAAAASPCGRIASAVAVKTAEKLVSAARCTDYRGPLVLLLFHSDEVVRIWARETLLHLVNLAASLHSSLSSSRDVGAAADALWFFSVQLLCAVRRVTSIPFGECGWCPASDVADGICSLLAVLTALDAKLAEIERSLLRDIGAAESPFGSVSSATVLLLGGSMLLYWILSAASTENDKEVPLVMEEMTVALNARLGIETTLQPISLASDTRRALVKTVVHCLLSTAKYAFASGVVDNVRYQRRMRGLWTVASKIDPPSTAAKQTGASPAKSAGWLLRFLMRNASVQLNMPVAVRGASCGDTVSESVLRTMDVVVHVIAGVLISLADSLSGLAASQYYHQFLTSVQKDCVAVSFGVALRSRNPQAALSLLRHFMLTDLIVFSSSKTSYPTECLSIAWDAYSNLLLQSFCCNTRKEVTTSLLSSSFTSSASSPLLLREVVEMLDVIMVHPLVSVWLLLKPLDEGPQPLASIVASCIGRATDTLRGNVNKMQSQEKLAADHIDKNFVTHADKSVINSSLEEASRLLSSGSSIPRLTHVLLMSKDPVTQRLGEALFSFFLSSLSSVVCETFCADGANWLLQTIFYDPVLSENALKLNDARVDAVARTSGTTWAKVMCCCNWSNLRDDVSTMSWWLCALIADVCILDPQLRDQLLDVVVTQLPRLTGVVAMSDCPFTNYVFFAPSMSGDKLASVDLSCLIRRCAQHLLLTLVQKWSLYTPAIFVRAMLHVAGALPPPTKTPSDQSFISALSQAFEGVFIRLPADTKSMMTDYASTWMSEVFSTVQQCIDRRVTEQNRSLQNCELEEKRLKQMEEVDKKRAVEEKMMRRANVERRQKELADQRNYATTITRCPIVTDADVGVKRPRDELMSLMIAQTSVDGSEVTSHCVRQQQQQQQKQQCGGKYACLEVAFGTTTTPASELRVPLNSSVSATTTAAPRPTLTASQKRLQLLGEQRVKEFFSAESLGRAVDAIHRVACRTDVHHSTVRTDDIIGEGRHCLAPNLPTIPSSFTVATRDGYGLYVASFFPHIAMELRYELHQRFCEIIDCCRALRTTRDSNRSSNVLRIESKTRTGCDSVFSQPSRWIISNAAAVVCTGDAVPDQLDPTCLRVGVMMKATSETSGVSSLSAAISEGDIAVFLMPLASVAASLPFSINDAGDKIPETWSTLGCIPHLCLVTSLQPGSRTATLTFFTQTSTGFSLLGSSCNSSTSGIASVNFRHLLRVCVLSQIHSFVKRLCSIASTVSAVCAIHNIKDKVFGGGLLNPRVIAKTNNLFYQTFEHELLSSSHWPSACCNILLHSHLNEWQMQAIATVLVAVVPRWGTSAPQSTSPFSNLLAAKPPNIFLIEGPPGTGKTQTIAVLLLNLLHNLPKTARRLLVCAPSNCAVDEVLLRMQKLVKLVPQLADVRLLRIGVRENIDYEVLATSPPLFLDDCISAVASGSTNIAGSVKKNGRVTSTLNGERTANGGRHMLRDQLICGAHVVYSTLGSLTQLQRLDSLFDVVIVDEASQGTEPDVLQALILAKKWVVLVGDPKQLQPTVLCQASAACGFKRSLLQRLLNQGQRSSVLRTQYRMHPDICAFSNRYFYSGKLITDGCVIARRHGASSLQLLLSAEMEKLPRFIFVDVQEGRMELGRGCSWMNRREAEAVVVQMRKFRAMLGLSSEVFARHSGIITFYQAQKEAIFRLLSREERDSGLLVATVDSFQGKEKDIIFISCVRAPHVDSFRRCAPTLGFLEDWHRINVSLTRSKEFCVLFGHAQTFRDAAHAAKMKEEQQTALPFLAAPVAGNGEEEVDDEVTCEETPPADKSDDDPFVFNQLLKHVVRYSRCNSQTGSLDTTVSAAIFNNSKNLHVVKEMLQRGIEKKQD